jgi:hypothetical protein
LVPHSFPLVEAPEFRPSSPIFVPLLCDIKNHDIVGSALSAGSFLIIEVVAMYQEP